jgi:hypothetical protein
VRRTERIAAALHPAILSPRRGWVGTGIIVGVFVVGAAIGLQPSQLTKLAPGRRFELRTLRLTDRRRLFRNRDSNSRRVAKCREVTRSATGVAVRQAALYDIEPLSAVLKAAVLTSANVRRCPRKIKGRQLGSADVRRGSRQHFAEGAHETHGCVLSGPWSVGKPAIGQFPMQGIHRSAES